MELDMVANMEVDMVADNLAYMGADLVDGMVADKKNGRHGVGYGGMADMEMRWTWTLTRTWTSTWKTFIAYLQRHEISQILILKDRKSLHQATFIQPDTSDKNIIIIITTKDFPTTKKKQQEYPQYLNS